VEYWDGPTLEHGSRPGLDFPATDDGREAMAAFAQGWVRTRVREDFLTAVWRKLAVNCVVNPLTALLRVRNRDVIVPETSPVRQAVFEEVRSVAALEGTVIEAAFGDTIDERMRASLNWSSMLQDVERGRTTEIDFLNGAVAARGRAGGVPAPVNAALAALIRSLSKTRAV
jgi:2-dehydropantoate 2-reductase